jgi:hypothetical protein
MAQRGRRTRQRLLWVILLASLQCMVSVPTMGAGPLRVHPSNPRYFTDGSGNAIYLTGSHTWQNLQDRTDGSRPVVDFAAYLDFLARHHHNFIRLWMWEDARNAPLPYPRPGEGTALDGRPRFDLHRFDRTYFDRLRARVIAARDRGIYVSLMLFQGWSIEAKTPGRQVWSWHPFHRENNVNGIDGDANGNGDGEEVHTLRVPAITELQEAYLRQVVDTVNDLDNVLFEVSNESHGDSTDWQYHMLQYLHAYEAGKPQQHPVGMTIQTRGKLSTLLQSAAEWISPGASAAGAGGDYQSDPPAATGAKVILADTDHLFDLGKTEPSWVWKSFTRGLHPIVMDPIDDPRWEPVRRAMGQTLTYARRMELSAMTPRPDLCSTGYCLADPRSEFLVYLPPRDGFRWDRPWRLGRNRTLSVDLSAARGTLQLEWYDPATGEVAVRGTTAAGARRSFTPPFAGDGVLYLRALQPP